MKNYDRIYHVAHPNIAGTVIMVERVGKCSVWVNFDVPVGFSGNKTRGEHTLWLCTAHLLHSSSEEAHKAHIERNGSKTNTSLIELSW